VPEGDVVWYTARRLHEALAGRTLTRSDFRVPRYATADLTGQAVTEAVPRGKHLLIRTDGGLTIHTHLKMEGAWRVRPADAAVTESHKIRLLLANAEYQAIGYQLGITELVPTSGEETIVGHLGPDLLDPDWDETHLCAAVANLKAPRNRDRPVAEALLDQTNLAGIGNLYKCEVLFLRGISPWRPVTDISDEELATIVTLARRLLDVNKARIGQVTTGLAGGGTQTSTWVYGRRGARCRRCGTVIRKQERMQEAPDPGKDRVTFWCLSCQPR
jgi:endonuclease-8